MARNAERPPLLLTQEQRSMLQEQSASRVASTLDLERAKAMLGCADGVSITELQRRLGFSRPMSYRCVDKTLAACIQMGLKDMYHRPHEPEISDEAKAWVVSIACTKPKDHGWACERWSISPLARFVGERAKGAGFPRLGNAGKSSGHIFANIEDRHRSSEFIGLLIQLGANDPKDAIIRVVLNNHSAHISRQTMAYLNSRPGRFESVHTPKHGSWLNLIECAFSKMARTFLRHIRVSSKQDPKQRIYAGIAEINASPVAFCWNKLDLGTA